MEKTLAFLIVTLLAVSVFYSQITSNIGLIGATSTTLRVPTPEYPTIQAAIKAASPEDTISVAPGVYFEHPVINKTVRLIGDNKETTIIDGNGTGPVVHVTAANVSVSGFTIQNAIEGILSMGSGLFLAATTGSNVSGNIIRNNRMGVYLEGSSGNLLGGNMITNNVYGIYFSQSEKNNFFGNNATDNTFGFAISLYGSSGNTLRDNHMSRNSQNFKLYLTSELSDFVQDIDSSNMVDGKPIYYWMNQRDRQVPADAGYVAIVNSTNITVKDLVLTRNGEGVLFVYTANSTLDNVDASNNIGGDGAVLYHSSGNNIFRSRTSSNLGNGIRLDTSDGNVILGNMVTNNSGGIRLDRSTNNLIYGNTISDSRGFGIDAFDSYNNTIYNNSFVANAVQVSRASLNSWDAGYPSGGNFWSDYTGTDDFSGPYQNQTGSDGIGDTPYIIDANSTDRYPLMNPPLPLPAFVISVSPFSQEVKPDQSVTFTVTVISVYSFNSGVHLNGTLNPISNNLTFVFNPETVIPPTNGSVQSALTVTAISTAAPATYVMTVNATNAGHFATDMVEIIILDIVKPTADAGPDHTVDEDAVVTFDGSGSYDNVGVVNYTWTFIDVQLQTLTGVNPTYVFHTPGTYVVTLNVTDAAGNWAADKVTITVLDVIKPVANAGQDQTVQVGTLVTFDGSGSTDNVGIVSYEWNFGDGSNETGVRVTHAYSNVGTYNVTLTVKDAAGNSDTDSVTVTVTAGPVNWSLLLLLAAAGGATIVGIFLGAVFWRRRKRRSQEPARS